MCKRTGTTFAEYHNRKVSWSCVNYIYVSRTMWVWIFSLPNSSHHKMILISEVPGGETELLLLTLVAQKRHKSSIQGTTTWRSSHGEHFESSRGALAWTRTTKIRAVSFVIFRTYFFYFYLLCEDNNISGDTILSKGNSLPASQPSIVNSRNPPTCLNYFFSFNILQLNFRVW